jgi:hypothetical protein
MSSSSDNNAITRPPETKPLLHLLAHDIIHVARKIFGSEGASWVILLFASFCIWWPAYQFSFALINYKAILVSIPLLIQFATGLITFRAAINWGRGDND